LLDPKTYIGVNVASTTAINKTPTILKNFLVMIISPILLLVDGN